MTPECGRISCGPDVDLCEKSLRLIPTQENPTLQGGAMRHLQKFERSRSLRTRGWSLPAYKPEEPLTPTPEGGLKCPQKCPLTKGNLKCLQVGSQPINSEWLKLPGALPWAPRLTPLLLRDWPLWFLSWLQDPPQQQPPRNFEKLYYSQVLKGTQ